MSKGASCLVLKTGYKNISKKLSEHLDSLSIGAHIFILCKNEYDDNSIIKNSVLDVIDLALTFKLDYINTLVIPQECNSADSILYGVWLSKDRKSMKLNKDAIREKHIWKDVEWGKREKNYNPLGKDPGNVWIPTEDDGKGKITRHVVLSEKQVIDRILKLTDSIKSAIVCVEELSGGCVETTIKGRETPPYPLINSYEVVFDTSESMKKIRKKSVELVVTSPPYWDLKNYLKKGQIGQESYETYQGRMTSVWNECYNKLSDTGLLWININIRTKNGKLIPIANDIVSNCKKLGFYFKGIFIWHKSSGIPTGEKNIVDRFEFVLVFSKNEKQVLKNLNFSDYKNENLNGKFIWNINRKAGSVGKKFIHTAIYPNQLTDRAIILSTNPGNVVCDPFLGSGTTLISAINKGRSFVGYEYNEQFEELIKYRIGNECNDRNKVKFVKQC